MTGLYASKSRSRWAGPRALLSDPRSREDDCRASTGSAFAAGRTLYHSLLRHLFLRHAGDDAGLMHGRRIDLQDFEVVGAGDLVMYDAGGLQHAVSGAERKLALLALVDETDPALQHIEHLEVAQMLVQAGRMHVVIARVVFLHPDDVGAELAVRGVLDA